MVREDAFRCVLVTLTLLGARAASADPTSFTGSAERDFPSGASNVQVTPVDPNPQNRIYQMPEMTSAGLINGYAMKDIRTSYDAATDTLAVGVNTYGVAGTAVGNGGAAFDAILNKYGGVDEPNIGGQKSISVAFAADGTNGPVTHGDAVVVAGVPADKAFAGPGTDGFTVASYTGGKATDIENHYGQTLLNNVGSLAFDPSAAHPNFEFTIKNFSKIPGLDPNKGFWMMAYAGSPNDYPIGEENFAWTRLPAFASQQSPVPVPVTPPQPTPVPTPVPPTPPQQTPEPATWLAWSLLAGGAAWRFRRRAPK